LFVDKKLLSGMGIKKEKWLLSLLVGVGISLFMSMAILFQADFSQMDWAKFAKASVVLCGAGGLFELFLYYSFIHTRLEKAFGVIPAILLSAFLYILWHTGTQIPLETNPVAAYLKLFAVGIMYQSVFSLTRNVLIIWPFFHWSGVMIDFVINISELDAPVQNFLWAVTFLITMLVSGGIFYMIKKQKTNRITKLR
jgi:membrane protease YdiL (CAAX protease family)